MTKWRNPYIALLSSLPDYLIDLPSLTDRNTLALLRTRLAAYKEIKCEIGSGSGQHLLKLAQRHPDSLCLGIELRFKRAYRSAEKAAQLKLANVLVVRSDAKFLPELISPKSLSALYLNFPDPWPKRRWKKHRLLSSPFIETLNDLLQPNGIFSYKTDHEEYFNDTRLLLEKHKEFRVNKLTYDLGLSEDQEVKMTSEFELMFRSKEKPIFYLEAEKVVPELQRDV